MCFPLRWCEEQGRRARRCPTVQYHIDYSHFARDHNLGRNYILRHVYHTKAKNSMYSRTCLFPAIYHMWTKGNMRSVIKEADPQNGGFPRPTQNGGFRMLLQAMKMPQSVQLPPATTVSSLCGPTWCNHSLAMASHASNETLDGCHFKIFVPLQTLCEH